MNLQSHHATILLEVSTPIGSCTAYRPDVEEIQRTATAAKAIFQEAFLTNYRVYHLKSGSAEPIESWLRLREGLTLETWLSNTFDDEYADYLSGKKSIIYLCDTKKNLIGWLSHGPLIESGEVYLSQCSLEADSRNHKVATTIFVELFKNGAARKIFHNITEVKLIARKINTIAERLYVQAGFIKDETIDPGIYGECYDDRYVGYRLCLS